MTGYAHTEDSHDTVARTRYPCAGKVKKIKALRKALLSGQTMETLFSRKHGLAPLDPRFLRYNHEVSETAGRLCI